MALPALIPTIIAGAQRYFPLQQERGATMAAARAPFCNSNRRRVKNTEPPLTNLKFKVSEQRVINITTSPGETYRYNSLPV
jgi:hypothetical protein